MVDKPLTKIADLTATSKQVNILAKVVSIGETREIPRRFGPARKVADALVGDETGAVVLSLWENQIGTVQSDEVVYVDNGYVSLIRDKDNPQLGHIRLNVGKYGTLTKSSENISDVNQEHNISEQTHEMPERERRGHRGYGGGREHRGGGERNYNFPENRGGGPRRDRGGRPYRDRERDRRRRF